MSWLRFWFKSWVVALLMVAQPHESRSAEPFEPYMWPEGGFIYPEATITPGKARELARRHFVLTLLNVKELSADVARNLVTRQEGTYLTFPTIEKIDARAATAISRRPGFLRLWGLKTLSPDVAAGLGSHVGETVELTGVKQISPEVAKALACSKRRAILLGITELSAEIATNLAEYHGNLWFDNVETISLETATALSRHHGQLDLGKARISTDVAETLLAHDGDLALSRVKRLEPGVADILAKHKFEVFLMLEEIDSVALARKLFNQPDASSSVCNLRTISPQIAREVVRFRPGHLDALDSLSPESAVELARCEDDIVLLALNNLSPEVARALTERTPAVYLKGIKSLEGAEAARVAEVLASTPAPVYLEFLERVSPEVLAVLRKKPTIKLPPAEKLSIVPTK